MKFFVAVGCCIVSALSTAWAQVPVAATQDAAPVSQQASRDAERQRISTERARLEAGYTNENASCYQTFFVNSCLEEVKSRRGEALADLRRQEISLNEQERKAKAADQLRKTEEKSSPEKQQQDAEKRADALRNFQSRADRESQKSADRASAQANEQANRQANANRLKNSQEKAAARVDGQAAAAERVKQLNEKQQKARERQERHARDELARTKPAAKPLPVPP